MARINKNKIVIKEIAEGLRKEKVIFSDDKELNDMINKLNPYNTNK